MGLLFNVYFFNRTFLQWLIVDASSNILFLGQSISSTPYGYLYKDISAMRLLFNVLFLRQMHFFGASLLTLLYRLISATQHFSTSFFFKTVHICNITAQELLLFRSVRGRQIIGIHRRRINTEEKAKVVAAVWGKEFNSSLRSLFWTRTI